MVSAGFTFKLTHSNPVPGKISQTQIIRGELKIELQRLFLTLSPPFKVDDNFVYLVQVKFQEHRELFRRMRN